MAKHIIGKKLVTQIGGSPQNPLRDDEIVGELANVYVSAEEANNASSVIGHSSEIIIGNPNINEVNKIIAAIKDQLEKQPANKRTTQITNVITLINEYESAPQDTRLPIANKILQTGANIAQIMSLLLQLGPALNALIN